MHTSVLRCTNWCYTHSYVTHGLLCINWMRKQLPVNTIPFGKCSSSHQYGQAAKCYRKVIDVLQSEKCLSFNDKEKFIPTRLVFPEIGACCKSGLLAFLADIQSPTYSLTCIDFPQTQVKVHAETTAFFGIPDSLLRPLKKFNPPTPQLGQSCTICFVFFIERFSQEWASTYRCINTCQRFIGRVNRLMIVWRDIQRFLELNYAYLCVLEQLLDVGNSLVPDSSKGSGDVKL